MKIEFYYKETGIIIVDCWEYFVMNDEVYRDNYRTYESQAAVVSFDDFIERCYGIGWRVIE